MMAIETRAAPLQAERPDHQHQTPESTTTCAFCGEGQDVYQMGDKWICLDHIGLVVSLAANDLFSGDVHYTKAFETAVLM